MLSLVEFPQIAQHSAPWFEAVFSAEALVQFQQYLKGQSLRELMAPLLAAVCY